MQTFLVVVPSWRGLAFFLSIGVSPVAAQIPEGRPNYGPPPFQVTHKLSQHVSFAGFDDPKMTLTDALLAMEKTYDIAVFVETHGFRLSGFLDILRQPVARTPIPAMQDVPLAEVLRTVVGRVPGSPNVAFLYEDGAIMITTRQHALATACDEVHWLRARYPYNLQNLPGVDVDLFAVETLLFIRNIAYWNAVILENAKALAAEQKSEEKRLDKAHLKLMPLVGRRKDKYLVPEGEKEGTAKVGALSIEDVRRLRDAIYTGTIRIGHDIPEDPSDQLDVPRPVEDAYRKDAKATVDVLLEIVRGGRPSDSLFAAGCAISLVESPQVGAVVTSFVRELDKYDVSDKHWGCTPRFHWARAVSRLKPTNK